MPNTIEREIRFFRVDIGPDDSGKPKSFSPTPVFEHIDKLKWTSKGNRYWDDKGKITGCWVHSAQMPCKVALGTIRRSDLPDLETQGELTPLEIPENSGLVERTHIVFLDDNIVGCDTNFYGPRITRLANYLAEKANGVAPEWITFNPILRQDVYKQLAKVKYLKLVNMRIMAPYAETIAKIDENLAEAFRAAHRAGDADDIEVILQASKASKGWLSESLLNTVKQLGRNKELQFDVATFKVHGYSEEQQKSVILDLLSDKLVIKRAIVRTSSRSRSLNPASAYQAIISAYNEVKGEIRDAASELAPI